MPDIEIPVKAARAQLRIWSKNAASGLRLAHGLGLIDAGFLVLFAWGLSHAVSDLQGHRHLLGADALPIVALLVAVVARAVIFIILQRTNQKLARRIVRDVRLDLMDKALAGRIDTARHQNRLNALFEDTEALEGYYARFVQSDVQARLLPLVIIALIACASPVGAGLLLLTLLPFVALMAVLGIGTGQESKRQLDALSRLSNLFVDRIKSLPLILAFDAGPRQAKAVDAAAHDVAERTLRVLKLAFLTSAVLEFFSALSIALIAVYCGFYLLGQLPFSVPEHLNLAKAFFVLALAPEVYAPMRRLAAAYHDRQTAVAATQRLMAISLIPQALPAAALIDAPEIVFDEVVCGFPDDPGFRIGPVSFTARPGSVTALTGPTGAGKTTLLRLFLGQGHILSGRITVNGQPLNDLAASLAWVSQHPPILAGSLADNLRLGQAADDAQLRHALDITGLGGLVASRAEGLETALNERGSGLSGGERRRIGLARAVLKGSPLWLLDEPTADLDAAAEAALMACLPALFAGRTVIFSSHSPVLCALADQIVEVA
ncbi:thiol reductant ABC exporter subunit CydD [Asticcacaulis sp. EMRT-3]|uniref:thiol reductant ABC exporter subunit CydD n=1 Tax=Asticcacaulis sp. EMRT-3 TaxID=3040349 RepID=UPI0024AF24E4|nr:thiol reductant ABC exporter subunit CydD [Asticcacaulis sp. EMRT-3]MDI7773940.1 thiol reductant ABC exporter subunit CydD [Asticcacaulis sp. EMRT-3]